MSLSILIYNIAANYPGIGDYVRIDKVREKLIEGDYDIIGLNEVYNKSLRNILLDDTRLQIAYPHRVYTELEYDDLPLPWHTFDSGLVILSKHPITAHERYQYQERLRGGLNEIFPPKDLLYCKIDYEQILIDVFFTHLQWGDDPVQIETRKTHFKEIRTQVDRLQDPTGPTIICGDLNIYGYPDTTDEYTTFKTLFDEFTDSHMSLHPNDPALTWTGQNAKVFNWYAGSKFDYIFVSHHFKPQNSLIHKWKGRVGPYVMKWKPTNNVSSGNRLRIEMKRFLRFLVYPIHILLMIGLTFYRIRNGYPQILFLLHKDLSDHYALSAKLSMSET